MFRFLIALVGFTCSHTSVLGDTSMSLRGRSNFVKSGGSETCTDLLNKGSHFAVKVAVGTPPQTFELVADTGSDAVIVTSCVCVDNHLCMKDDKCFRGTNHSTTFMVSEGQSIVNPKDAHESKSAEGPLAIKMTFGSGSVTSIIATDTVAVGNVKANMNDGLLLMVDRSELKIEGQFEGILGMGPRGNPTMNHATKGSPLLQKDAEESTKGLTVPSMKHASHPQHVSKMQNLTYAPKLFLDEIKVDRFSICFNDAENPGSLRLNVPEFQNPVPAIGSFHWGLGLHGISAGSADSKAFLCDPSNMKEGQKTPCGAIPDSGTTLLMGPKDHVVKIYSSLCQEWSRCRDARKDKMKNISDSEAFQTLLYKCADWMSNETGIDEVPSVFLTVGEPGNLQRLELTAWSYVIEQMAEEVNQTRKDLFGIIPVVVQIPTGKFQKVCTPSIGVQEYNTKDNGPVWILGTPLFYQYNVGYSLSGPSMSFKKEKCSLCNETKPSFLSSPNLLHPKRGVARRIRTLSGPPRVGHLDTSLPL